MDISKILEEPLIVEPEDSVNKVASKLLSQRKHEALVVKDKKIQGIILVNDLVKRNIQNPEKTKINSFIRKVDVAFPETSVQDAINSILINNFKSLPVESYEDDRIFIVTKINLMKTLKGDIPKGKTAKDIMNYPYCISNDDTISTAKSILKTMDISVIPVVNKNSKVGGVIETIDLLKTTMISFPKPVRGEEVGEKKTIKNVTASSIMQKNIPRAAPETPLNKIIDLLVSEKMPVVIIEENEKLAGIITPRDILKLFGGQREGVYVTISGIHKEDDFIKTVIDEEITNEIKKLAKKLPIQYLAVNIDKYKKDGKRAKYTVKSRLVTQKGAFFSQDFAWDITKAIRGMLHKLEKEIIKKTGKRNVYTRAP